MGDPQGDHCLNLYIYYKTLRWSRVLQFDMKNEGICFWCYWCYSTQEACAVWMHAWFSHYSSRAIEGFEVGCKKYRSQLNSSPYNWNATKVLQHKPQGNWKNSESLVHLLRLSSLCRDLQISAWLLSSLRHQSFCPGLPGGRRGHCYSCLRLCHFCENAQTFHGKLWTLATKAFSHIV